MGGVRVEQDLVAAGVAESAQRLGDEQGAGARATGDDETRTRHGCVSPSALRERATPFIGGEGLQALVVDLAVRRAADRVDDDDLACGAL